MWRTVAQSRKCRRESRIGAGCFLRAKPMLAAFLLSLEIGAAAEHTQSNTKITLVSYGDWVERGDLFSSKEAIEASFAALREAGTTEIYWRLLWEGLPIDHIIFYGNNLQSRNGRLKSAFDGTPYAWNPHEISFPVEAAHKLGMKFYAWIVPFNEGAPPEIAGEYHYMSRFTYEHPEFLEVDRTGKKRHYGVLEFAYPEARKYWLDEVQTILGNYGVDGIYLDTRTESPCPEFADQFGFSQPVVTEYLRRYGVDILVEDFDLDKWRALRGEFFTLFLREMAQKIHARGKAFSIATSRGDYLGYPLSNMKLEWRKWIEEGIIDALYLDEHGWCYSLNSQVVMRESAQPIQPYGFLTDYPTGRGLKSLEAAVREDYAPLCRKKGVKLYFRCYPYQPRPIAKECCMSRAAPAAKPVASDWCDRMAAMPEFDGMVEVAPFFLERKFPERVGHGREKRAAYPFFH